MAATRSTTCTSYICTYKYMYVYYNVVLHTYMYSWI